MVGVATPLGDTSFHHLYYVEIQLIKSLGVTTTAAVTTTTTTKQNKTK